MDADYYVLGIALSQNSQTLSLLAYIGGISAASAMVIVTTLALSSMCLNHLLLPLSYPDPRLNLYYWLLWGRRLLIGIIIFAGFVFYSLLEHRQGLVQLGLISFVAVAQFIPGIIGPAHLDQSRYNNGKGPDVLVLPYQLLVHGEFTVGARFHDGIPQS